MLNIDVLSLGCKKRYWGKFLQKVKKKLSISLKLYKVIKMILEV